MAATAPGEVLPDLGPDAARLARELLAEDGPFDLTSAVTLAAPRTARATLECRAATVVAGLRYGDAVLQAVGCSAKWEVSDGTLARPGAIGRLEGNLSALLRAERPLLNLLQRASGIAAATRDYVQAVAGYPCRILHTRKTAPGLRLFDAAAVLAGGGALHRLELSRTLMIKDNHWRALSEDRRRLDEVMRAARERGALACQVEVESEAQLREACRAGADRILIDNQTPQIVREWGDLARALHPGVVVEATGGINLTNAAEYARAGADFLSIGALTHSVRAADLALELD